VHKVHVRVITATNRDLRQLVKEKKFREDLFYRLAMLEVSIPKLSERREDLPLLERHFLQRFSKEYGKPLQGLTRRAQSLLARHVWPGNVRELENAIGNACMMADGPILDVTDLPEQLRVRASDPDPESAGELVSMEQMELRHLQSVLQAVQGNKVRAGEVLGISRGTLYRLLGKLRQDQTEPS
jgi:DNA-binding NtrC family response regulator